MTTTLRTASGDLVLPRVILTDPGQVALQSILDSLQLWLGEWFMDGSVGFPWLQQVLGVKNPSLTKIKALLRQTILAQPYVVDVVADAAYDNSTRAFAYSFAATLNTGQVITGGSGTPFSVTGGD